MSTPTLSDQERESVKRLQAPERYSHFVKRCADHQEVWVLADDSGWASADHEGRESIPVWPHRDYAQECAVGGWAACEPKAVDIYFWLDEVLPDDAKNDRLVAVFPLDDGHAIPVDVERIVDDLRTELERLE